MAQVTWWSFCTKASERVYIIERTGFFVPELFEKFESEGKWLIYLLAMFRMDLAMTFPTEGDEIFFSIMAKPTSRNNVVNFQSPTRTAALATPSIALQNRLMQ